MDDEFCKTKTNFKMMAEKSKEIWNKPIFICKLSQKGRKINLPKNELIPLFERVLPQIKEKFSYLMDENGSYRVHKTTIGFNIPVKKKDFQELMHLLVANSKGQIQYYITESYVCPHLDLHSSMVQFRDLPPEIDKKIFSDFGEVTSATENDGLWTVLFKRLDWYLPLQYHKHLQNNPKNRWFDVFGFPVSFSSKVPCSGCGIKGHHRACCPGESLTSKLVKEKEVKDQGKLISINQNTKQNISLNSKDNLIIQEKEDKSPTKSPSKKKNKRGGK
jgi:hypothetical protein